MFQLCWQFPNYSYLVCECISILLIFIILRHRSHSWSNILNTGRTLELRMPSDQAYENRCTMVLDQNCLLVRFNSIVTQFDNAAHGTYMFPLMSFKETVSTTPYAFLSWASFSADLNSSSSFGKLKRSQSSIFFLFKTLCLMGFVPLSGHVRVIWIPSYEHRSSKQLKHSWASFIVLFSEALYIHLKISSSVYSQILFFQIKIAQIRN